MTGALASNNALERTAFILDHVTEFVDPRVFVKMNENQFRHAVMAAYPTEKTTNIPEHAFLDSGYWDERARGLGLDRYIIYSIHTRCPKKKCELLLLF